MKLLSFLWEFWQGLSFKAKFTFCSMVFCAAVGWPRTSRSTGSLSCTRVMASKSSRVPWATGWVV